MAMDPKYVGKVCRFKTKKKNEENVRMAFVQGKHLTQITPPQIVDKRTKNPHDNYYDFYLLNDTAAFIASLVFQHVPVDLVTQAYMSRFGITDQSKAENDITTFLDPLSQALECVILINQEGLPYVPPSIGDRQPLSEKIYLNFDVDYGQMGGTYIKIPPT